MHVPSYVHPFQADVSLVRKRLRAWPGPRFLRGEAVIAMLPGETKECTAVVAIAPENVIGTAYWVRKDGQLDGPPLYPVYENALRPPP